MGAPPADVTLLLAARPGSTSAVVGRLRSVGASVGYRDDDVDYLRVEVPVARASRAAAVDGALAATIDRPVSHGDQHPIAGPGAASSPAPGPGTPPVNPHIPTGDIGAPQFVAAHPTYDRRGTTLGIVDDGVDLLTPSSARLASPTVAAPTRSSTTRPTAIRGRTRPKAAIKRLHQDVVHAAQRSADAQNHSV